MSRDGTIEVMRTRDEVMMDDRKYRFKQRIFTDVVTVEITMPNLAKHLATRIEIKCDGKKARWMIARYILSSAIGILDASRRVNLAFEIKNAVTKILGETQCDGKNEVN